MRAPWACLACLVPFAAAGPKCPGSGALIHASCTVEVTVQACCADVLDEMLARVDGQYSVWHDPHNNGTYAVVSQSQGELLLTRTSGSKSVGGKIFTDKVLFTFSDSDGACSVGGCSESQVTSVADFSTNYCNMRNMYCGKAEGCAPVKHDFASSETASPSIGASKDPAACVVAAEPRLAELVSEREPEGVWSKTREVAGPCCNRTCAPPLEKYFSVDAPHGFCGETCLDPREYSLFHVFEKNLTKAEHDHPCKGLVTPADGRLYTDYIGTVTHGAPFGALTCTLDLYAPSGMPNHSCCITPHFWEANCTDEPLRPTHLSIFGTGPYCCPSGATERAPCPPGAASVIVV